MAESRLFKWLKGDLEKTLRHIDELLEISREKTIEELNDTSEGGLWPWMGHFLCCDKCLGVIQQKTDKASDSMLFIRI